MSYDVNNTMAGRDRRIAFSEQQWKLISPTLASSPFRAPDSYSIRAGSPTEPSYPIKRVIARHQRVTKRIMQQRGRPYAAQYVALQRSVEPRIGRASLGAAAGRNCHLRRRNSAGPELTTTRIFEALQERHIARVAMYSCSPPGACGLGIVQKFSAKLVSRVAGLSLPGASGDAGIPSRVPLADALGDLLTTIAPVGPDASPGGLPELSGEAWVAVRNNLRGQAVVVHPAYPSEQLC